MSATISIPSSQGWARQLFTGHPHQVVGNPECPYLLRWFVIPQNRWCNIYLHRFLHSDDPVPHDHPWSFISVVLSRVGYLDVDEHGGRHLRRRGSIAWRPATWRHHVALHRSGGHEIPATTIIVTGPRRRHWGFWCTPTRFTPWRDFGPGGCGEPRP